MAMKGDAVSNKSSSVHRHLDSPGIGRCRCPQMPPWVARMFLPYRTPRSCILWVPKEENVNKKPSVSVYVELVNEKTIWNTRYRCVDGLVERVKIVEWENELLRIQEWRYRRETHLTDRYILHHQANSSWRTQEGFEEGEEKTKSKRIGNRIPGQGNNGGMVIPSVNPLGRAALAMTAVGLDASFAEFPGKGKQKSVDITHGFRRTTFDGTKGNERWMYLWERTLGPVDMRKLWVIPGDHQGSDLGILKTCGNNDVTEVSWRSSRLAWEDTPPTLYVCQGVIYKLMSVSNLGLTISSTKIFKQQGNLKWRKSEPSWSSTIEMARAGDDINKKVKKKRWHIMLSLERSLSKELEYHSWKSPRRGHWGRQGAGSR